MKIGNTLRLETFGESHAPCIGMRLEGFPEGEKVDLDEAVRCALALGKRRFVLAAFPGVLLQMLNEKPKKKRRGLFRRDK